MVFFQGKQLSFSLLPAVSVRIRSETESSKEQLLSFRIGSVLVFIQGSKHEITEVVYLQSNFNGSNTFGTVKINSKEG